MSDDKKSIVNVEATDLAGIGRAGERLVKALGDGIAGWTEAWRIRRRAEAEADADVIRARGELRADAVRLQGQRYQEFEAIRHQENLVAVTRRAVEQIEHWGESATDTGPSEIDPDWFTRFRRAAQDIGNEQMQGLWGKVLAEEAQRPGQFSLRTLRALEDLSRQDAELFTRLCTYVWFLRTSGLLPINVPERELGGTNSAVLRFEQLQHLVTIGLLHSAPMGLSVAFSTQTPGSVTTLEYFGEVYLLEVKPRQELQYGRYDLTQLGRELRVLVDATPDEAYRDRVLNELRSQGFGVTRQPT